jgi:hypothetical protein
MENKDFLDLTNLAKQALTEEQKVYYKAVGEHMYSKNDYTTSDITVRKEPDSNDIAEYASRFIKSGGSPDDLLDAEIIALNKKYGERWYLNFSLKKNMIRRIDMPLFENVNNEANILKPCRQQKRMEMKKQKKNKT